VAHDKADTKRQTLSACTLSSGWCPRTMGPFPLLCLLAPPHLLVLQGLRNGFCNFHLPMTQCLLLLVPAAVPGYSLCLAEITEGRLVSPIEATSDMLWGRDVPAVCGTLYSDASPWLTLSSSVASPLRSPGEGLPEPQCLSAQKSPHKH